MRVVAMLVMFAFMQSGNADPRIGSWTVTSADSSLTPPNTLSITPVPDGVHLAMGGETHLDFTARSNGHGTAVTGNPAFNQIELHRISKKQSEVKEKKDGALVATVREQISNDGKELTIKTSTSGRPDAISVWTRSGGAIAAGNLFAGDWTQNMGKTRLRQGLVLKIEPDGVDGIRFSGDYSFTGRPDGKPYDLKNSRNDSVRFTITDSHTVDATYQRDNQLTQKDRWVVAADGRTMTLLSKATLESGQQLAEHLVFQKQ